MSELRKVVFRLDDTEYGFFDLTDEERKKVEELQKPQKGFFHDWEDKMVTDEETGTKLKKKVAIIEDSKGKIHKVEPELIQFDTES